MSSTPADATKQAWLGIGWNDEWISAPQSRLYLFMNYKDHVPAVALSRKQLSTVNGPGSVMGRFGRSVLKWDTRTALHVNGFAPGQAVNHISGACPLPPPPAVNTKMVWPVSADLEICRKKKKTKNML